MSYALHCGQTLFSWKRHHPLEKLKFLLKLYSKSLNQFYGSGKILKIFAATLSNEKRRRLSENF